MITQRTAEMLNRACRAAIIFLPRDDAVDGQVYDLCSAAIEAARQDQAKHEAKAAASAKADALRHAREVDEEANRVVGHRYVEQNGG